MRSDRQVILSGLNEMLTAPLNCRAKGEHGVFASRDTLFDQSLIRKNLLANFVKVIS